MAGFRIISADDHVFEPPDLWTSRVEPKFRDRAPQIIRMDDDDWWVVQDVRMTSMGAGTQTGMRLEAPERLHQTDIQENVRLGGYIPEDRIKDMDTDGVDVSVIYPTAGFMLYHKVPESDLLTSLFAAYNDWIAEFCNSYPKRLKGLGLVSTDDVELGVGELERCAKLGLAGALISSYPPEARAYNSPEYDPLWAAAQDLEMPLSLHTGANRVSASLEELGNGVTSTPATQTNHDHWTRMSLAHMIFTGVFERYPKLQVGSIEIELSWAPHFLDRLDYTYQQRARRDIWYRFKEAMLPSQYFHRNVFLGFQEDSLGIRLRDIIGVDSLMWGSDYPHHESTWPYSHQVLEEILADCTEEEKAKIAGGNAARIYHLD